MKILIGVLAIQGSFREHISSLKRIDGVDAIEVRTKEDIAKVHGLIIPGGESTTMALVADRQGIIPDLQQFVKDNKPVWGTCAGLIFLANKATGTKQGGQALLGGLDCQVHRNFFGAQINSFETRLPAPSCLVNLPGGPPSANNNNRYNSTETSSSAATVADPLTTFRAVFIRAPGILESGPEVEILAEYTLNTSEKEATGRDAVTVAVRSGHLMATAFHPELTDDARWHALFVDMVRDNVKSLNISNNNNDKEGEKEEGGINGTHGTTGIGRVPTRPADLPVYH